MGSYTPVLKYYKSAPDEVVDVEQQLNYNWDITDLQAKRLLEYEYVSGQNPNVVGALNRSRFYKEYSNSIQSYFGPPSNFFWQDPKAFVTPWTAAGSLISGGYSDDPDYPVAYRLIKYSGSATAEVEWTGAFWLDNAAMDLNLNIAIAAAGDLPAAIRPTVTKYFDMWGGNTATDFSVGRILIGNDGRLEFKRYGVNPGTNTGENRLEFTGIIYNVEVTGT